VHTEHTLEMTLLHPICTKNYSKIMWTQRKRRQKSLISPTQWKDYWKMVKLLSWILNYLEIFKLLN